MGLLGNNNSAYDPSLYQDWNSMPPAQLAFQQALDRMSDARLNAAAYRATASSMPAGDPAASVYGTSAAEAQKIADMDPTAYMMDLRNKKLTGDKDVSAIAASDQSTAHDKMKMDQEKQVWDDDNKLRAQLQLSVNGANGGSAPVATPGGSANPAAAAGAPGSPTAAGAPGSALTGAPTIPTSQAPVAPGMVMTPYGPLTKTQVAALVAAPVTKQREMLAQMIKGTEFEQELDQAGIPRNSPQAQAYAQRKYNVVDQPTPKMLDSLADEEKNSAVLMSLLDRYQQAYTAAGGYKLVPGAEKDNLDSLHSQIRTHLTKMNDMGVLKKYDMPLINAEIGSATEWSPWKQQSLDAQVKNLREGVTRGLAISRQTARPGGVATINATGQDPGTGQSAVGGGFGIQARRPI